MSVLTIYPDDQPNQGKRYSDFVAIERALAGIDVKFERWIANRELTAEDDQETVIAAYQESIAKRKKQNFGKNSWLNTPMTILKCGFLSTVVGCFTYTLMARSTRLCAKKATS
jgi:hypothetical protein